MIPTTDLKNGTTFMVNSTPYKVVKYSLIKMGRGGATVRVTARNLLTGTIEDKTFSSNVKVESIDTGKRKLQYLFADSSNATFIDPNNYEQVEIPRQVIAGELPFIKEGDNVDVLFWQNRALSLEIAPKTTLTVTSTDPGVKGNSATNVFKPAKLENGLEVKVPLFIKTGDKIRVDTRTGEYVERAK